MKIKNFKNSLVSSELFDNKSQQLCRKFNSNNNSINLTSNDVSTSVSNSNESQYCGKYFQECEKDLEMFLGIIRTQLIKKSIYLKPYRLNGKQFNTTIYNINEKIVAIMSNSINDYRYEVTSSDDDLSSCNEDIRPAHKTEDSVDSIVTTSSELSTEDSS